MAILVEAAPSFLGLGIQPPTPASWCAMVLGRQRDMFFQQHLVMILDWRSSCSSFPSISWATVCVMSQLPDGRSRGGVDERVLHRRVAASRA